MSRRTRTHWSHHIDQIVRSRHYTWLAEGLGGEPTEEALAKIMTDIRHICRREGISFDDLLEQSAALCDEEELALAE